jgi:hypothetical protein
VPATATTNPRFIVRLVIVISSGFARHTGRHVSHPSHDATSSAAETDCISVLEWPRPGALAGSALAIANGIQGEGGLWSQRADGLFVQNHSMLGPAYWTCPPLYL